MGKLKKILNIIKNNKYLIFLIFLSLAVGLLFPFTYWAFVDDGELIEVSERLTNTLQILFRGDFFGWIKDPQIGRFRPAYWFYHWLVYLFFGINHIGHGLVHLAMMLVIVASIYQIAKKVTGNKLAGLLSGLFFVANSLNQENWYRLGPQEMPMTFFISASLLSLVIYLERNKFFIKNVLRPTGTATPRILKGYLLQKDEVKKIFHFSSNLDRALFLATFALLIPAYFMKENSIAYVAFPFFLCLLLPLSIPKIKSEVKARLYSLLLWNLILFALARLGAISNYQSGSYASEYIFTYPNILSNLMGYLKSIWLNFEPLIIVIAIYILVLVVKILKNKTFNVRHFISGAFLLTFVSFFIVQLPWRYQIPRYLFPAMFFLSLFIGISLSNIFTYLEKIDNDREVISIGFDWVGKVASKILWVLVVVTASYNLLIMTQYISRIYNLTNNFNKPLISNLSRYLGENGTVYLDTSPGGAIELKQEIGLHLHVYFGRNDIKVDYFSSYEKIKKGDVLLRAGEFKQVTQDNNFIKPLADPLRIDVYLPTRLYYPPMQFLKNYLPAWTLDVMRGKKYNFYPVLAEYEDHYYWEIYSIN